MPSDSERANVRVSTFTPQERRWRRAHSARSHVGPELAWVFSLQAANVRVSEIPPPGGERPEHPPRPGPGQCRPSAVAGRDQTRGRYPADGRADPRMADRSARDARSAVGRSEFPGIAASRGRSELVNNPPGRVWSPIRREAEGQMGSPKRQPYNSLGLSANPKSQRRTARSCPVVTNSESLLQP